MATSSAGKRPATKAEAKQESRHDQWWYPARCEYEGCDVKDNLKKCSACNMVMYCCKEHQASDWPLHKADCKAFRRLGARATFYTDAEMLARFPLTPPSPAGSEPVPKGACCALCNTTGKKVHMTRTRCCDQVVCDTSDNYQLGSYSREFCERSHQRYTLCGRHGVEKECDATKDWRQCGGCTAKAHSGSRHDAADVVWRGLNPYNYCPLLEADVPRHSVCEPCVKCGSSLIRGLDGGMLTGEGLMCMGCAPNPFAR